MIVKWINIETENKAAKHKTEEVDEVNHKFKYSLIDGGILGEDFESISYDIKMELGGAEGGAVITIITTYRPKGDEQHNIQQKIKQSRERTEGFVHVIEAHLHANPHD